MHCYYPNFQRTSRFFFSKKEGWLSHTLLSIDGPKTASIGRRVNRRVIENFWCYQREFGLVKSLVPAYINEAGIRRQENFYLPNSGPSVLPKNPCKVPKAYMREPIKTRSARMRIKVWVPPAPKTFSAHGTSPINS